MGSRLLLLVVITIAIGNAQTENWSNVSSPYGRIASFVTVDNGNRILMGTSHGVWRSDSSLSDWKSSNNGLEEKYITVMYKLDNVIFSGTTKGIFKSTDEGAEWIKCPLPDSNYSCIISTKEKLLYVKAFPGPLYVSADFGKVWKKIIVGETESDKKNIFWNQVIISDSSGTIYVAADSNSYYYSMDNGVKWKHETIPCHSRGFKSKLVINGTQIIFRTGNQRSFYTKRNGSNWEELKTPEGSYKNIYLSMRGSLILSTSDPDKLYESADNGLSWQPYLGAGGIGKWERISNGGIAAIREIDSHGLTLEYSIDGGLKWTNLCSSFGVDRSWSNRTVFPGEVTVLETDNNKYLYAGTKFSGAYRTSDFGSTWQPVLNQSVIRNIAIAGDDLVIMSALHNIYLLTNDCKTVDLAAENGLHDSGVTSMLATRDGVVFIGFYSKSVRKPYASGGFISEYQGGGLWRSTDFGKSWEKIYLDPAVKPAGDGKTWLKYNTYSQTYRKISQPDLTINSMGISPEGNILVDAEVDYRHGLYSSSDDGNTWTRIRALGMDDDGRTNLVKTSRGEIFTGHGLLFAGISRSSDGGKTYNDVVNGFPSGDTYDLIALPDGAVLCTTEDGIYYLPYKGNTWSCVAFKGVKVGRIMWYGEYIFASVISEGKQPGSGIYRIPLVKLKESFPGDFSEDEVWKEIDNPFKNNLRLFEIDAAGDFWAVNDSKELKHSGDEGGKWKTMSLPDEFIYDLVVDNADKSVWISTSEGLFRSTSAGAEWTKVGLPDLDSSDPYSQVITGALYFDNNGDIMVGAADKVLFSKGHIFISKNGGKDWDLMKKEFPGIPSSVFRSRSGRLFCTVSGSGLFYSTDNGAEWNDCNTGLLRTGVVYICNYGAETDRSVGSVNILEDGSMYVVRGARSIAVTKNDGAAWKYLPAPGEDVRNIFVTPGKTIYAATDRGVFKTENAGETWTSFSAGLYSSNIISLHKDRNGYLIAVASDGRIYKTVEKID